ALAPERPHARHPQGPEDPAGEAADGRPAAPPPDGEAFSTGEYGATTQLRRWTDVDTPAAAPPRAAPAPVSTARLRQLPFVITVLVLVLAGAGFATWRLSVSPEPGFLAEPGDMLAADGAEPEAAAPPETTVVEAPAAVSPAAEAPVAVVVASAPAARPAPAAEAVVWYDLPALPEAPAQATPALIEIRREAVENPVFATLREAYEALLAGDAARAETLYREALVVQPGNRDALLGLATLAARAGRADEARDHYLAVKRQDPKNATALAALSALPGAAAGNTSESGLKTMLREQPTAAALHFALGLRYVGAERWSDAQLSFFEAVRHEPSNPDYAFNLAVSLDRLGQAQPAASYYQRALELARGSQQFDPAVARARLDLLRAGRG
ncbi:MAG: tetratricopeptide repeat protein, partial [Gammaproteobacteria bacterium]|nr:tetratricopeptide repeat protein [Gammaproteobacteria bacterium]